MIFYFSATGNSLWVARELAREFGGTPVSVTEALRAGRTTYRLGAAERVFLVFPVHAWGPAVLAERFIGRLTLEGYDGQEVYLVCVCGDDCGRADRLARRALALRGIALTGAFSIQMPNTYILLPGFDVDADAVAAAKLRAAPGRLGEIIRSVREGRPSAALYERGAAAWLKTYLVRPLFIRFLMGRGARFRATGACVSCGLCARVCPTGNIALADDGRPHWGDACVRCLACVHRCPARAVEYGKATERKGRYRHPGLE